MPIQFVVTRVGGGRLMIRNSHYVAEHLEDDPKSFRRCLTYLGLKDGDATLVERLRGAIEQFYRLENRSLAKFGKPKVFRIWRVDAKTLQIDFGGGYAELSSRAKSEAALKRCLDEVGASHLLLNDLKRELAEFLREERA